MQLESGQTILLKQTRERAKVVKDLGDGQWMVEAEMDRERFPVHEDDIDPSVGSRRPQPVVTEAVTPGEIRLSPGTDGYELQLAFLPVGDLDYTACLLNHSEHSVLYTARLLSNKGQQWVKHGILKPIEGLQLGHLYRDLLNENSAVELQVSRKAELGTDSKQDSVVKLKPKLFHKNQRSVNWFPEDVTVFDVFARVKKVAKPVESIASYTKANAPDPAALLMRKPKVRQYGVQAAADFPTELDLHIDKLVGDASTLTGSEMLQLQLDNMRAYLEVAIRMGIDRVFLIHGAGKGALRNAIHEELARMGDLEGFKNEHHPKYGFGATEVVLR